MRRRFCNVVTVTAARDLAPWACKIVKVTGGWLAFESWDDWATWTRQR